jgi:hypothetical protein
MQNASQSPPSWSPHDSPPPAFDIARRAAWGCRAGGSSASSASSASSDKSSDKSSDSSSKNTKVAAGPYRIVDLAAVPQRPGTLRVRLQALAGAAQEEDVVLFLPQQAIERSRLTMGQTVIANKRPYGTEFAVADTAFFLLLNDDWFGELAANPVVL